MEIKNFALRVVTSDDLDVKLKPAPGGLTDRSPGRPRRLEAPGRPEHLTIAKAAKVPSPEGWPDPSQRRKLLHALANHELQAAELFAWALLAFPDAPSDFRRGLLGILDDEQRHTRMYLARLQAMGGTFGDQPVSGYFWNKTPSIVSPLHFVCAMSLTFENANLDHSLELAAVARAAQDEPSARVLEKVHRDEIEHVRFGWHWLHQLKPDHLSAWQAYEEHLQWPLRPAKAKGASFHSSGRRAAGFDEEFIRRLEESLP